MRRNVERVLQAWRDGRQLDLRSISTNGTSIYSYGTCIVAVRQSSGDLVVNMTPYSTTTSAQQNSLRDALCRTARTVTGLRRGATAEELLGAAQREAGPARWEGSRAAREQRLLHTPEAHLTERELDQLLDLDSEREQLRAEMED